MVISQGEIWWADLPAPAGSGPGYLAKPHRNRGLRATHQQFTMGGCAGKLPRAKLGLILAGIDVILGK
jgi:hypothetical protein